MTNGEYELAQLRALGCVAGGPLAVSPRGGRRGELPPPMVPTMPVLESRVPPRSVLPQNPATRGTPAVTSAPTSSAPGPSRAIPVQRAGRTYYSPDGVSGQRVGRIMLNSDGTTGQVIGGTMFTR